MDAGRAAREQVGALQGGVGDAELGDRLVVVLGRPPAARSRRGGIVAPHMLVKRLICSTFVIGMMPGTIGTSMPAGAGPLDEVEVVGGCRRTAA